MRRTRGLTLVEVLMGVLLLSLVGALAFSQVVGARRSFDRQADRAERILPALEALDLLAQDLMGAFIPDPGEPPFFNLRKTESGSELALVSAAPPVEPDAPLSRHRVLRVVWRVEADEAGRPGLVRTARPDRASGETPPVRFRLPGVRELAIRAYGPVSRKWEQEWLAGRGGTLPAAARVEIRLETSRGIRTLTRETVIPAGLVIGPAGG